MKRTAAKSTGTKSVSMRQLANRKENMSDIDGQADGQNVCCFQCECLHDIRGDMHHSILI